MRSTTVAYPRGRHSYRRLCVRARHLRREVRPLDLSSIKKSTTTRAGVASLLGPDGIVEVNGHEIFHYYHLDEVWFDHRPFTNEYRGGDVFVFLDGKGIVEDIVVGKRNRPRHPVWPFGD